MQYYSANQNTKMETGREQSSLPAPMLSLDLFFSLSTIPKFLSLSFFFYLPIVLFLPFLILNVQVSLPIIYIQLQPLPASSAAAFPATIT